MTYAELIASVAADAEISKKKAKRAIESALRTIRVAVANGETMLVPRFGAFVPKTRKARLISNPQTRSPMHLPASKSVGFRASKHWKAML